jgi:hypothetical protein
MSLQHCHTAQITGERTLVFDKNIITNHIPVIPFLPFQIAFLSFDWNMAYSSGICHTWNGDLAVLSARIHSTGIHWNDWIPLDSSWNTRGMIKTSLCDKLTLHVKTN